MKQILIIEDDHDVRVLLRTVLEREGYSVQTVSNGKDGLQFLREYKPSLILLDLMMPIMDGWEFLNLQKSDPEISFIPTVIMSTSTHLRPLPKKAFILKPLSLETLLPLTKKLCRRKKRIPGGLISKIRNRDASAPSASVC